MDLEKTAKLLGGSPIPMVVLLFGGLFIISSITADGKYIFESFTTFIYGVLSSYARIVRKDNRMGYWTYFIFQAIFFVIWAVAIFVKL